MFSASVFYVLLHRFPSIAKSTECRKAPVKLHQQPSFFCPLLLFWRKKPVLHSFLFGAPNKENLKLNRHIITRIEAGELELLQFESIFRIKISVSICTLIKPHHWIRQGSWKADIVPKQQKTKHDFVNASCLFEAERVCEKYNRPLT